MGAVARLAKAMILLCFVITMKKCKVYYNIVPSESSQCSPDSQVCSTLEDFNNHSFETNVTLYFSQGWHYLHSELMIVNSSELFMHSDAENTWIICEGVGFLTIYNVTSVQIQNMAFMGCGESTMQEINLLTIYNSTFQGYYDSGTALFLIHSKANITQSSFLSNTGTYQFPLDNVFLQGDKYKQVGGAIAAYRSELWITACEFHGNNAEVGGALFIEETTILIAYTLFENNFAKAHDNGQSDITGGVVIAYWNCYVSINYSTFSNNSGLKRLQGVLFSYKSIIFVHQSLFVDSTGNVFDIVRSNLTDWNSIYEHNNSTTGAVLSARWNSNVTHSNCQFTSNHAVFKGGVIHADHYCTLVLKYCDVNHNTAIYGGAINVESCTLYIENSRFYGQAATLGSVLLAGISNIITNKTVLSNNSAKDTGILYLASCNTSLMSTAIINNSAHHQEGMTKGIVYATNTYINSSQHVLISGNFLGMDANIIYIEKCTCEFNGRFTFLKNSGSFMAVNSRIAFHGYTRFQYCSYFHNYSTVENGGAITTIDSTTYFHGKTEITRNHAMKKGGAVHATGSTVHMIGETIIGDNTADESGGGVYLFQSKLNCAHNCTFSGNIAMKSGGAIYAIASTVYADEKREGVEIPTTKNYSSYDIVTLITYIGNNAQMGGALAFEMNSKLYGSSTYEFIFKFNSAEYGGAVYVNDYTNSGTCASTSYLTYSAQTECFIQSLVYNNILRLYIETRHYQFIDNYAAKSGSSLYGGLLDRCTVSPIRDMLFTYIDNTTSRITTPTQSSRAARNTLEDIQMISSDPVRICFCRKMSPDCSYRWPGISVMKGHPFTVTLVAVDQVNHSVNATIRSFLSSPRGGLGEGQQSQSSYQTCTKLTFNAFSPLSSEKLTLYAEGPCNNTGISKSNVFVHFTACICPIGFQPVDSRDTNCDCICDPRLYPQFITSCNPITELLTREDTSWIGYHREINHSGYIIYRYCPYDYCYPPTHAVKINLNVDNGADAQCNLNRSGLLCGACKPGLSLSLGSTRCILCPKQWPGLLITIILAGILCGLVLVATLQVLNLTVAVGTINGIIFYTNIIAANFSTFIPATHPNVLTVFISWLNLDLGIDVCFVNGMNTYVKQWLQLIFPTYVIVLVAMVILISERSARFAKLIGRGNPIATLATLILLSYTKYLRAIIDIFSFAILKYPDDSVSVVWLPDATVRYLSGKHVLLFLVAVLIVILGIVYTFLLFAWQWLQLLPRKRVFQWIWYTRVNSFMDAYLASHTPKHRYWTGLLLIARIVLYLVSALNLSNNPRINLLAIGLTISCLFVLKAVLLVHVYRKWPIELVEFSFHVNLLLLTYSSFYSLGDSEKQTAIVYTSISISLALFFGILLYHIISTMFSTTWMRNLMNKATQRKNLILGDAQTALLLGDYDNYMESAAVAPTSTIVEISPEHSTQDSRNIDLHDPSSFTSLDMQSPPETETLVGNNNII
jgi:predicted outer membrane repeat protein